MKGGLQRLSTQNDIIASGGIREAPCCDSGDGSVEATTGAVCSRQDNTQQRLPLLFSRAFLLFVTLALIPNGIPLREVNNQSVRVRYAKMESALAHPRVRPDLLLSSPNVLTASALSERRVVCENPPTDVRSQPPVSERPVCLFIYLLPFVFQMPKCQSSQVLSLGVSEQWPATAFPDGGTPRWTPGLSSPPPPGHGVCPRQRQKKKICRPRREPPCYWLRPCVL